MTTNREKAKALALEIEPTLRRHHPGGGEQFLVQLVDLVPAEDGAEVLARKVETLIDEAWVDLGDGARDRQALLEQLITDLRLEVDAILRLPTAKVILFKASGAYYTEEPWRIPAKVPSETRLGQMRNVVGPFDMRHSPDFRRIDGGAVLVEGTDREWPPHLFPNE